MSLVAFAKKKVLETLPHLPKRKFHYQVTSMCPLVKMITRGREEKVIDEEKV